MKIGTCHFVSIQAACKYYADDDGSYTYEDEIEVSNKLNAGEIHIGPPEIKEGETLSINEEGRYVIAFPGGG